MAAYLAQQAQRARKEGRPVRAGREHGRQQRAQRAQQQLHGGSAGSVGARGRRALHGRCGARGLVRRKGVQLRTRLQPQRSSAHLTDDAAAVFDLAHRLLKLSAEIQGLVALLHACVSVVKRD